MSDHQCADKRTLVTVNDKVSKIQRRTGNNAIVVHGMYVTIYSTVLCIVTACSIYSNTVSRSAIFCAVSTAIEMCKTEGVVDVFQVVKAMRAQKPGAIQTVVR